jgi:hypothetical protein
MKKNTEEAAADENDFTAQSEDEQDNEQTDDETPAVILVLRKS